MEPKWRKGTPPDAVGYWFRKHHAEASEMSQTFVVSIDGVLNLFNHSVGSMRLDDPIVIEKLSYPEWWWYGPVPRPPGVEWGEYIT